MYNGEGYAQEKNNIQHSLKEREELQIITPDISMLPVVHCVSKYKEEEQRKPIEGSDSFGASADFESHLHTALGDGIPLPVDIQMAFEPRFADFSNV